MLDKRRQVENSNIAIVRLEQLYPLDKDYISDIIKKYRTKEIFWIQEEPENMGAASYISLELKDYDISVVSREASAATASGSSKISIAEQDELINKVFKI